MFEKQEIQRAGKQHGETDHREMWDTKNSPTPIAGEPVRENEPGQQFGSDVVQQFVPWQRIFRRGTCCSEQSKFGPRGRCSILQKIAFVIHTDGQVARAQRNIQHTDFHGSKHAREHARQGQGDQSGPGEQADQGSGLRAVHIKPRTFRIRVTYSESQDFTMAGNGLVKFHKINQKPAQLFNKVWTHERSISTILTDTVVKLKQPERRPIFCNRSK